MLDQRLLTCHQGHQLLEGLFALGQVLEDGAICPKAEPPLTMQKKVPTMSEGSTCRCRCSISGSPCPGTSPGVDAELCEGKGCQKSRSEGDVPDGPLVPFHQGYSELLDLKQLADQVLDSLDCGEGLTYL